MNRLTPDMMSTLIFKLNLLAGTPLTKMACDGKQWSMHAGHYWIQSANGRHRLVLTITPDGQFVPVLNHRFVKLRTCYEAIEAFITGFKTANKNEK